MANPTGESQFSERPKDRDALYERIRTSSKEAFILEDMQRLGFWPREAEQPSLPAQIIQEETILNKELNGLLEQKRKLQNIDELIRAIRKKRMEESLLKRAETKKRREQQRLDRAAKWAARKQEEILTVGPAQYSAGLNNWEPQRGATPHPGLPQFENAMHLAEAMGLTVGQLRWLCYHREVSRVSHYRRFLMRKKTGGTRLISAPMPRLKAAQHWILDNILSLVPVEDEAQGFVPQRSILTNARPHVGAEVMVNMDVRDFFPTFDFRRVQGLFERLGYPRAIAVPLAMICTESPTQEVELDGQTWYIAEGDRRLPQGSPCSPAITNLICRRLDRRMAGMARRFGFTYTRYADDLSFSAKGPARKHLNQVRHCARLILSSEGLTPHPDKERVMRGGARKEVTGIVVNEKMGIEREALRKFRAFLHQVARDKGFDGKRWGHGKDTVRAMLGFAAYVRMVDPARGTPLLAQARELARLYAPARARGTYKGKGKAQRPKYVHKPFSGVIPGTVVAPSNAAPQGKAAPAKDASAQKAPDDAAKPWWKFWK